MREVDQDNIMIPNMTGPIAIGIAIGFPILVALLIPELVKYEGDSRWFKQ